MIKKIRDDRQLRALTGLGFAEFERLLPVFSAVYEAERQKRYEQAVQAGTRRRKPGGGRKSKLPTMADKLFFVLPSITLHLVIKAQRAASSKC